MPQSPSIQLLDQPFSGAVLGEVLTAELQSGNWTSFRAVAAFLKSSGLRHLAAPLDRFLTGLARDAKMTVGIDHDGTSLEGLQDLWRVMNGRGELYVFHEGQGGQARTFHPKVYLFENATAAVAVIGSGNLTAGGLFLNHELAIRASLDLTDPDSAQFHTELSAALDRWQTASSSCLPVDGQLLRGLHRNGDLPSEVAIATAARAGRTAARTGAAANTAGRSAFFGSSGATALPPTPPSFPPMAPPAVGVSPTPSLALTPLPAVISTGPTASVHRTFLIEVRPHHNGEVFLSKRAVDEDPGFFGFPFTGWTSPKRRGNRPYPMAIPDPHIEMVIYDPQGSVVLKQDHSLNTVFYTRKSEIRITIPPAPLALIPDMSLLAMTRLPESRHDFKLEFYPPECQTARAQTLRLRLHGTLPSGGAAQARRYGWT